MSKLVVAEFVSLDGVMQAPRGPDEDREGGFEYGGWQMGYNDDVSGERIGRSMTETGSFLLGRKTYEIFAAYWPTQSDDNPFAKILNGLPKYVASPSASTGGFQCLVSSPAGGSTLITSAPKSASVMVA